MKTIGVLICTLCAVSMWGGVSSNVTNAPQSFELICPKNVVLDCDDDLSNLSKWGDAYVLKDYKRMSAGNPTVVDERNSCGIGIITRTWKVEDTHWKWHTCTQVIQVKGGGGFGYHDITWPDDWTIDTCDIDIKPGNLPDPYSYPKFNNKKCAHPAYNYKDEVFNFSPTCVKVIRRWKVLDWCTYVPGGNKGIWEHAQVIKIEKGKGRPHIECPKDTTIFATGCDSADVELEDIIAISSCGDTLKVINNSKFADSNYGNASGKYPIGTHTFYYTVEYGCARELKCKVTITVKSAKPPTPYCKNGIITTLMPVDTNNDGTIDDGMREVWASDLDAGSFHACDAHRKLTFSFSSDTSDKVITFTCANIGDNEVEIWVTDEYGNQSYCITSITVQNNNPRLTDCEPDSLKGGVITGSITMYNGANIKDADVQGLGYQAGYSIQTIFDTTIINGSPVITQRDDTTWTDLNLQMSTSSNGKYAFKRLPMHKDYEIQVVKNNDVLNGVNIWDYYALQNHLQGWYKISDKLNLLSADVNGDNRVDIMDAQQLISAILFPGTGSEFDSWRFYESQTMEQWIQSSNSNINPEPVMVADLSQKFNEVTWTGIKVGDLDYSVDPSSFKQGSVSSLRGTLQGVWTEENAGHYILELNQDIVAGDLIIDFGGLYPSEIKLEGELHHIPTDEGSRVIWAQHSESAKVIEFYFEGDQPEVCQTNIKNHVYTVDGTPGSLAIHVDVPQEDVDSKVLSVFPNPADQIIRVEWNNKSESETTLSVFNSIGQLVIETKKGQFSKGINQLVQDVSVLPKGQTYFFKIEQESARYTGSFVKQ